jgi:hypothetical protein
MNSTRRPNLQLSLGHLHPSFIKEAYDAFNFTFDAWHSHPHRHFDRAFRPLIHENAVSSIALRQINRLWGASVI